MSASESNGSAKTSGQDTHAHKKTSLCYLITQILTYIHKAIILKNNKTLPQTDMKTTVISYPVYRKELWCWFTLYSCLFLQILAFLGVPQLPQALHETMRDSPLSTYRFPHSSPFSMTALLSLNSFKLQ